MKIAKHYVLIFVLIIVNRSNLLIAQPIISSFSPLSGPIGSTVSINGSNFNAVAANNIVYFGATRALVSSASSTQLSVIVPDGMTYEPISVTNSANGLTGYSKYPFATSFVCGYPIDSISLVAQDTLVTGSYPYYTAAGDIDGDGKTDLGVVNYSSNTFSIYRNISVIGSTQINYASRVDFLCGNGPMQLRFVDLDGDGKKDVVTSNSSGSSITVRKNVSTAGIISFSSRVDYPAGSGTYGVSCGDIDGDGKVDIVATNVGSDNISVFKNNSSVGSFSFSPKVDYYSGDGAFFSTIFDVDGDEKVDVVVTNASASTLSFFRNLSSVGTLSFAPTVTIQAGSSPEGITAGDIDGDGKIDIATADWGGNSASVYRNTSTVGSINFDTRITLGANDYPLHVYFNDLDGDAKSDLVVSHRGGSSFCIYRNQSIVNNVSFSQKIQYFIPATSIAIADMDGDRRPDIAAADFSNPQLIVLRNLDGTCQVPVIDSFLPKHADVGALIDIYGSHFNNNSNYNMVRFGDTRAQVVSGNSTHLVVKVPVGAGFKPIAVIDSISNLLGSSDYFFTPTFSCGKAIDSTTFAAPVSFTTNTNPDYLSTGDLDGDGLADVVLVSGYSNAFSVYRNTSVSGVPNFAPKIDWSLINPHEVEIADMDGDGKLDVIVAEAFYSLINVYKNTSTPGIISLATPVTCSIGFNPWGLAIGDIDKDGRLDMAICNYGPGTISVFRNTSTFGNLSFAPAQTFVVGSNPWDIAIGDLDGDHYPELVVGNYWSHNINVFKNLSAPGTIQLDAKIDYYIGQWGPNGITFADVDKDGKSDVLIAVPSDNFVAVLKNISALGTVSLAPSVNFSGGNPGKIAIADWDGNGEVEFFTGGQLIGVFQNESTASTVSLSSTFYNQQAYGMVMADIDGDKKNDAVFTNRNMGSFSVVRNVNIADSPTVSVVANTLTAPPSDSYQWLDCNTSYAPISGATSQSYTAPVTGGSYAVVVTRGTCMDTSVCVNVLPLGVETLYEKTLMLFPNPASHHLIIECQDNNCKYAIDIYNALGALVFNSSMISIKDIDVNEWEAGIYYVRLSNDDNVITKRFIKE